MPVPIEWPDGSKEDIPSTRPALRRATEQLTRLAERDLRANPQPSVYEADVSYAHGTGQEPWRVPSQVGDGARCGVLSAWRAAELRLAGDRRARVDVRRTGPHAWHAFVRRGDGRREDPSKRLGMGTSELGGIVGAAGAPARSPATITWHAARQRDGTWRGEVRVACTDGQQRPIGRGTGRSRTRALASAINTATGVLDNPVVRTLLPPQATAALAVLRSRPVARAASGALRLARKLGIRL
jgi:hypothetical protein